MKKLPIIYFILMFFPSALLSQDEIRIFHEEEMIWFIENFHPISQQGDILINKGESTLQKARGSFDPYVYADLDQKFFDNKDYYSLFGAGLKVPTWYGIEIKAGYDQNTGAFLNPENNVPSDGLWYAGISVPIGQGLFIDERRATLKQAELYVNASFAEQQSLMNNLYFDAIKQYWKWVAAYNKLQVYEESVDLAMERFEALKRNYALGDRPAIDTLEAFILVQNREIFRNELELEYQNTSLELSNYLWFENNIPLEITDSLRPPLYEEIRYRDAISAFRLESYLNKLVEMHPELQLYQYKQASLEVENRLKAEALKPKLNLNYNFLSQDPTQTDLSTFPLQNYKWGLEFSFPIFNRKQRGELQLNELKIQETELEQIQKLLVLENKVRGYYNEQAMLNKQIDLYSLTVDNYSSLLNGERKKFSIGESSLFLVNSRENGVIDARLKLIDLMAKYNVAQVAVVWASGSLYERKELD